MSAQKNKDERETVGRLIVALVLKRRRYFLWVASLILFMVSMDFTYPLHNIVEIPINIAHYIQLKDAYHKNISAELYLWSIAGGMPGNEIILGICFNILSFGLLIFLMGKNARVNTDLNQLHQIFKDFKLDYKDEDNNIKFPKIKSVKESDFVIEGVHNEKTLHQYLHGLINTLYNKGFVKFNRGQIIQTGYPEKFIIKADKFYQLHKGLEEIGWYRVDTENGIQIKKMPTVTKDSEGVLVDFGDIPIADSKISKGSEVLSKIIGCEIEPEFTRHGNVVQFNLVKKISPFYQKGDTLENLSMWQEKIIIEMKNSYKMIEGVKVQDELWFLGEVVGRKMPTILDDSLVFYSLSESPHAIIIGTTGSGKTKTMVHVCMAMGIAYPKIKWFFGCGKAGADVSVLADYLSEYPMAEADTSSFDNDPFIQYANIINMAFDDYIERAKKWREMRNEGHNPSTLLEARALAIKHNRPDWYLERTILVIDELAAVWAIGGITAEVEVNSKGSIANKLKRILAEGRSYGVHLICCSQDAKNVTFPTTMRQLFLTQYYHNQEKKEAENFLKIPQLNGLKLGEFICGANALSDKKGNTAFHLRMPYIGNDISLIFRKLNIGPKKKKNWDYDLIYRDSGADFESMNVSTLTKIIRQAFLVREDYEVIKKWPADERYINMIVYDPIKDVNFAVGVLKNEETNIAILADNIKIEASNSTLGDDGDVLNMPKIFFIHSDLKNSQKYEEYLKHFSQLNAIVIFPDQYYKLLKQAVSFLKSDDKTFVFSKIISNISKTQSSIHENVVDEMYGAPHDGEGSQQHRTKIFIDRNSERPPSPVPRQTNMVGNVNAQAIEEIKQMKLRYKKGDAGEKFALEFERLIGYDTVFMRELLNDRTVVLDDVSGRQDGGIDLVRWVDREKRTAIGIQIKAQSSKPIDSPVLDRLVGAGQKYEGINFISFACYNIVGSFTRPCYNYKNIQILSETDIKRILKNFEKRDSLKLKVEQQKELQESTAKQPLNSIENHRKINDFVDSQALRPNNQKRES